MRLLFVVVLILAASLAAADVSALRDAPSKRLLRSPVSVDEEEERGMVDTLLDKVAKVVLKPNQFAVRTMDDRKVVKAAKTSLLKTFKSVDPMKFNSVEEFFRGKAFNNLENYILRLNKQDINKQTSVAKVFSTGFGDEQAFHLFFTATQSSDEAVKRSGTFFRDQLLTQWATEGKTWTDVAKTIPKGLPSIDYTHIEKVYFAILTNLARDSQGRATHLAKLERARAIANAAT
ncbi:hypothetical protein DVH05_020196 [Phytophthora capsici]|nr:hypothetical protein DVH05_020196 [Phytophthora capsici]